MNGHRLRTPEEISPWSIALSAYARLERGGLGHLGVEDGVDLNTSGGRASTQHIPRQHIVGRDVGDNTFPRARGTITSRHPRTDRASEDRGA